MKSPAGRIQVVEPGIHHRIKVAVDLAGLFCYCNGFLLVWFRLEIEIENHSRKNLDEFVSLFWAYSSMRPRWMSIVVGITFRVDNNDYYRVAGLLSSRVLSWKVLDLLFSWSATSRRLEGAPEIDRDLQKPANRCSIQGVPRSNGDLRGCTSSRVL